MPCRRNLKKEFGLCPWFGLCPTRPKAERGPSPFSFYYGSGGAEPRFTSGGKAAQMKLKLHES